MTCTCESELKKERETRKKMEYVKKAQKRIPLMWLKSDYESNIEPAIHKAGMPVSTFIKAAVREKIQRDYSE